MEMLHHNVLKSGFEFTVTTAGDQTDDGKLIAGLLRHHPWIKVEEARHTPKAMAELYSHHDIVAMPSQHLYWQEAFGMVSVEAQHAGCRVVATKAGGLPETDCGLLELSQPGNSYDMALKINELSKLPPVTPEQRAAAAARFTRAASVDQLLRNIKKYDAGWPGRLSATGSKVLRPRLPKNLPNIKNRLR
jgi:glycosyltransferase involved in cell wall biosynthesis